VTYLRVTVGWWRIDLKTPEGDGIFARIQDEGVRVLREQPGFVRYRLMRADAHTTVAVAEWESEDLGLAGAKTCREWLKESGIADKLMLETTAGEVVVAS
jgi:hypothetical protein